MKTYLGIDQSYTKCALVFLCEDGTIKEYVLLNADDNIDRYDQAADLAWSIKEHCQSHKPDHICIEGLSFASTGNVTRDLAGLLFTIMITLRSMTSNIKVVPAKTLKKFAVHGNAKKEEMFENLPLHIKETLVKSGYKKTTGIFDLTDAYYLARYGLENETT